MRRAWVIAMRRLAMAWGLCVLLALVMGWVFWFVPISFGARRLHTGQILATTEGPAGVQTYWAAGRWFDLERGWYPSGDEGLNFVPGWEGGWWTAVEGTPLRIAHRRQSWGLFGSTRDWFEELDERAFARGKLFESWREPLDLFPSEAGGERAVGWPFLSHTARWQAREGSISCERCFELPGKAVYRLPEVWQWYQFPIGIIWSGLIGNSLVYGVLIGLPVFLSCRGRELSRYRRGVCPKCQYGLGRDFAGGCGECGWGKG